MMKNYYEAHVIITSASAPLAPANLRVANSDGSPIASTAPAQQPSEQTSTPTEDRVQYYDRNGAALPVDATLEVKPNEELKFSLWQQVDGGTPTQLLQDDIVLIAQYDSDPKDPGKPRGRKSPFNSGDLALTLEAGKPNDWTVHLNLNGAPDNSYFEYCVVALLDTGLKPVLVDPSIIINPNK